MLEQKMIVGRYINFTRPAPPPHVPGGFVQVVPANQFYLQESVNRFFGRRTSTVIPGPGPKAHRNFTWLPWLPGAISEVAIAGSDVLTGPMSGCWIVTYNRLGSHNAGHIGTDIDNPVQSTAIKTVWNRWAQANPANVRGFNPLSGWTGLLPMRQGGDQAPYIFGLCTTANTFYSIFTYHQNPASLFRIAAIQQIASSPLAVLQNLP